jgi:hypothetical protein
MRTLARVAAAASLAVASLAVVPAQPAAADPVDDVVHLVYFLLCPDPEVDLCVFDPARVCPLLVTLAPVVDALPPTAVLLYIDPATGDTYAGGTAPDDKVQDCAPYDVEP